MDTPAPQNKLNTSELPYVKRLVELQGDEIDDRFARRWLCMSSTSWYRIKHNEYGANPENLLERCKSGLQALEEHLEFRERHGGSGKILRLAMVRQTLDAVKCAMAETRDRLVFIVAPTGGGKSWTAAAIQEQYPGRVCAMEAFQSWADSYLNAVLGIAEALKIKEMPPITRIAERAVLDELIARPRILVIDESHHFGPHSINIVKAILNTTQCSVVLIGVPPLIDRLRTRAWAEVEQLRSRTVATITVREIAYKDLEIYLQENLPQVAKDLSEADFKSALTKIQDSANRFGLWDTVQRICNTTRDEANDQPITLNIIASVISLVERIRR